MRLYIFLALLLVIAILILYFRYQKEHDFKKLLSYGAALALVIFFTYFSKVILVHKPVFIVHLALLILSWIGLLLYIVKDRLIWWFILAPGATTLFFIIEALFFREHG